MRHFLLTFAICFLTFATTANAQLKVNITRGIQEPLPVAIPDLVGEPGLGADIAGVVAANLERSGLFRPVSQAAFIEQVTSDSQIPSFANWRQINTQALITGSVTTSGNRIRVAFRLWDIYGEQQIAGKEYNTFATNWRRIAHIMSDEIYKRLTGEDGYFDSRIVYVAESGPKNKRVKRLAIMDQDGENHKFLTNGKHLVLTPRFSPNSQEILYMSYAGGQPRVYLRDLQTGREESLGSFKGMSFAPRFSNDGKSMLMSIARNGVTNIYSMSLSSRKLRKLTNTSAIDTSPSFSPDGKRIVFNSDRGGAQQLYTMNANGSGVQRISFGDGRYGTPVWSPRGDWIAFTKISSGRFYIGVMRPDGSGERLLTESYLDEGPTWSPNGRIISFSRQERGGRSRLYSVDITGYNLREILTPIDASDPAWSPLLPM